MRSGNVSDEFRIGRNGKHEQRPGERQAPSEAAESTQIGSHFL
jgi:hypothetical protein